MVNIAGVELPLTLVLPVAVTFLVLIGIVAFLILTRGRSGSGDTPIQQQLALVIPVDKNETMGVGKLLQGVTQSETKIMVPDPDRVDNEGQPKTFDVDVQGVLPAKFVDLAGNIVTLHGIFDRGEWAAFSFGDLLNTQKRRYDPLEADPRDVGDFYVGWGFMRKMNQFLQSTTGKIMFGIGVGLIAYLLGIMTVALHVGHF